MLSSNKGITLMMLIITIIVLSILTAVTVSVGSSTLKEMQVEAYVAKMNMVQSRVNVISQKVQEGDTSYANIGTEISALSETNKNKVANILNGISSDGFKFYNQTDLKELGVEKIDENVIINLNTKRIYSMVGIKYEGTTYYNQYDLPNGVQVVDYETLQTQGPDFTIEKENYGLTVKVNITNIIYDEQINGSDIYYGEVTDSTTNPVTVSFWQRANGTSFQVTKTATYAVKVVDKNNGQTIKTVDVVTCNSPEITTGMVPVIYENGKWKKVQDNEIGKWYDYAEKKWANIMLSDGLVVNADGTIDEDKMGSMFVWIPRYAYCITSGYQQEGTGTIDIKFLKNTTYLTTDEKTTKMSDTAGQGNWIVHSVFKDGSENNYTEGGWDKELAGFWVAKFEASGVENGNYVGNANATKNEQTQAPTVSTAVRVVPNAISWRYITIGESQYRCRQMSGNTSNYGWASRSVDTHLIKNDEWGAVAYLCYSKYGSVPMTNNCGQNNGHWYNMYTGAGPYSIDNESTVYAYDANHAYNTEIGVKSSTTGNVYGIYDMAGGNWERVAGYLDNGNYYLGYYGKSTTDSSIRYFSETAETANTATLLDNQKYWCKYEVGEEEKNNAITVGSTTLTQWALWDNLKNTTEYNAARLRMTAETYNKMASCRGIGVNEVASSFGYYGAYVNSSGKNDWYWFTDAQQPNTKTVTYGRTWNSDLVLIGHSCGPFVGRGGYVNDGAGAGVFDSDITYGGSLDNCGFRPALVVGE